MFSNWQLLTISFVYIGLLFVIAFLGDKFRRTIFKKYQPIIYALTLGVYCTSWSFLGTTAQASTNVLSHLPIYLGPILLFVFAWPFIQRIIRVSLKLNLTSIADLLAARYGKSRRLASLVTIVALIGTMPYLALQIKAIVYSFQQLQLNPNYGSWQLGLAVSLVLGAFTVMFGIRSIDVTERHPGVMLAIAFESVVKLLAFLSVGVFVSFWLYESPIELVSQATIKMDLEQHFNWPNVTAMLGLLVVVMAAFLSLPRQFQVMVVELKYQKDIWLSRRVFPLYLVAFAVIAVPLGLAGHMLLEGDVPADSYVLFLPTVADQRWLTLLAFLGAISAASSMVIISAIALSTMLSNEIVFPFLFRNIKRRQNNYNDFRAQLLKIRKNLVFLVILLGYGVFYMASPDTISNLGEIAFGAIAQLTPALVAAFYWRSASLAGVYSGILVGSFIWGVMNFLPILGLYPQPLASSFMSANTTGTLMALSVNLFVMWSVSQLSRQSVQERVQASLFIESHSTESLEAPKLRQLNLNELKLLVSRFVGDERATTSFALFEQLMSKNSSSQPALDNQSYNQQLLEHTETTLASVMGASSARLVLNSAIEGRDIALDEIAVLVEEASSQRQAFGQNLLQSAIENAGEGISIVDGNLNLVAWNKRYLDLFHYPEELIYVGCPIEKLIRFNVERGLCGPGDIENHVNKRLQFLKQGSPHKSERVHDNGQVIHIQGNPLPDGGFVMMFSDISAYKEAERVLKDANTDLETLVQQRTQTLAETNRMLAEAREKAELAHVKKSQYLKACSHDLMQPLEAARLFTSALSNQTGLSDTQRRQVTNINDSLKVANDLLSSLGEVAKIESGNLKPQRVDVSLNELFTELEKEFSAAAEHNSVDFRVAKTNVWVDSDPIMLRRMLQNLLGNAFRYAAPGKVLLGHRRKGDMIEIQVLDAGPGIAEQDQVRVFEQFTQLNIDAKGAKGLGLGLNITKSFAALLDHPLSLKSRAGKGCNFSILVPMVNHEVLPAEPIVAPSQVNLQGVTVLCIDNDPAVLSGMVELLQSWQCHVLSAGSAVEAKARFARNSEEIEILLVDYQLEDGNDGLTLISELRQAIQSKLALPAILITATTEENIEQKANAQDVGFMRKLVKPAGLRAMMSAKLAQTLHQNYIG